MPTLSCREGCWPSAWVCVCPMSAPCHVCVCFCYKRNWDIPTVMTFICDVVSERLVVKEVRWHCSILNVDL